MTEKQPLLNPTSKLSSNDNSVEDSGNENNDQILSSKFNWRQRSASQIDRQKYKNLADNQDDCYANSFNKKTSVTLTKLYGFGDGLDYLLMLLSGCLVLVHASSVIASQIFFGNLMADFAVRSFAVSCQSQEVGFMTTLVKQGECPLGVNVNQMNGRQFHNLCRQNGTLSTIAPITPEFEEQVKQNIRQLLIVGLISWACCLLEVLAWSLSVRRQVSRISVSLFRSLIQRSMTYLDANSADELTAKLFDNIPKIELGIGIELLLCVDVILSAIGSVVISFIINWQLSLILLCISPVIIGASMFFSQLTAKETDNELTTYAKAGHIVQEVFSSVRTVHSLNGSRFEQKRYDKELDSTQRSAIRKGAVFGAFMGWISFINYLVYAVGFVFGSVLMSFDSLHATSINHILIIVTLFSQSIQFMGSIAPLLQSFSEGRGAAATVFQLIEEEQDPDVNENDLLRVENVNNESITIRTGDIQFDHVSLVYPSRKDAPVLKEVDVTFRANQTTALVGSSGSGKSTCISLLLRFYEPSSGNITIAGRPITDYSINQLRQSISVVSQEPVLFNMSIYENIRLGKLNATHQEIEAAAREANAHDFIMKLPDKYDTFVGERGTRLSGGEKQRIALARALVKQPRILLLDEATSALDNANEKTIQVALDRASKNRTTIAIAHRLRTIQNVDHIYVLDNGTVIEDGTHHTLMAKEDGKYQRMFKIQEQTRMDAEDENDFITNANITSEYERQTSQRSRASSQVELVTTEKEIYQTSSTRKNIFRRLLAMNSPEWITMLIGCIACVLNGLSQSVFPILLTKIVTAFKNCGYADTSYRVLMASSYFLLLGVIVMLLFLAQYVAFAISGSKLVQRIRSKAFSCLLRQEVDYFDRPENSSTAICVRLSSNAAALQDMTGTRLGVVCEALSLLIFGLIFGLIFNWKLTVIAFIPFLLLGIFICVSIKIMKTLKEESDTYYSRASSLAMETINNMRTVKQFSAENEILRQYTDLIQQIPKVSWRSDLINAISLSASWDLDSFIVVLLSYCSLALVKSNQLPMENIITVFAFITFTTQSIKLIAILSYRIGSSITAANIFFDLFDRTPSIDNTSTQGQELARFHGNIDYDKVKFAYPTRSTSVILNKLQINIKSGQRVALVGTSGCGKSTIVQLLERFYDTTQGQLLLDGVDIRQLNIKWLRSRLGLISQEPVLFDLTIAENITYALDNISMEEIIKAAKKANIHNFIQQLPQGYETRVGVKGSFLSGGEKQRIAIARVLLRQPKVLLLDEATSALDSHNEQIVQHTLDQAQAEDLSRTSIIIAHRLSTICSCDVIYVLDEGRVVENGTHAELLQQRGIYYKLFFAQNN